MAGAQICVICATLLLSAVSCLQLQDNAAVRVVVATGSDRMFRLSVRSGSDSDDALENPSLDSKRDIPTGSAVTINNMQGVETQFGALVASKEGDWAFYDAQRRLLMSSSAAPTLIDSNEGTIQLHVNVSSPKGPPQPCLSNGDFGPPFYYNEDAGVLAFSVSPWLHDPKLPAKQYVHCYPAGFTDSDENRKGWWIAGRSADWYFAAAPTGYAFSAALFGLTGPAAVPPKYAMGFMATYWGYSTMQNVQSNMSAFRDGAYPIDSFIMDYDWFGPAPCGPTGAQGGLNCGDYGYRNSFWGNETFVFDGKSTSVSGPAEILQYYHDTMKFRFAGIRKPRSYSNIELSNTSGWLLPDIDNVGAGLNNWNYTVADFQKWYTSVHEHFLTDGVDFWWNDEGETQWYTYLFWNMAQQGQWAASKPNTRMFTINRAFQPGMQRFAATTWTGDSQICSHGKILRFSMSGQPYTSCDLTSPTATVLLRQYQGAVFSPIMRVHQMKGNPRFPFRWCGPNAPGGGTVVHCDGFRRALELRYHFLPYLYSLSHSLYRSGRLIARPASFEFPSDATARLTYMIGESLIPADLSTAHDPDPNENVSSAYLPAGEFWYRFNSSTRYAGGQLLVETISLVDFPIYVRAGAILPLQNDVVQYSDLLGGVLQVHVYAGRSSTFDLYEDDGVSLDYQSGKVKVTSFSWNDDENTLAWVVTQSTNNVAGEYDQIQAIFLTPNGRRVSALHNISSSGYVSFESI